MATAHLLRELLPHDRITQRSRILGLLVSARGEWVGLPAILQLHIAQYNSRIKELRALGFLIENRRDAGRRSFFRLVQSAPSSLFGDISPDRSYRE